MTGRSALIRLGSDDVCDAKMMTRLTPEQRREASECWYVSLIESSQCIETIVTSKWPHAVVAAKAWIETGSRPPEQLRRT